MRKKTNDDLMDRILYELNYGGFYGENNPIPCKALIKQIGMINNRVIDPVNIRSAMNALRKEGHMIGANSGKTPHGYYLITSYEEWKSFRTRELESRLADISRTIAGMQRGADFAFRQPEVKGQQLALMLKEG